MSDKEWTIYLSGEIHSDWRDQLTKGAAEAGLPVRFTSPELDHSASDSCGVTVLGDEPNSFWKDHKGAKMNAIRTRTLLGEADIIVVRFGEKYKQWNAAFEAGFAAALGLPLIVMHSPEHTHALKEVDAAALVVAESVEQVLKTIAYVTS